MFFAYNQNFDSNNTQRNESREAPSGISLNLVVNNEPYGLIEDDTIQRIGKSSNNRMAIASNVINSFEKPLEIISLELIPGEFGKPCEK